MAEWRVIPGFESYEASSHGKIKNRSTGKILRCRPDKSGYRLIDLWTGPKGQRKRKTTTVNRAVCMAFHGLPPKKDKPVDASHLDGNCGNNAPDNLTWETRNENMLRSMYEHRTTHRASNGTFGSGRHEDDIPF